MRWTPRHMVFTADDLLEGLDYLHNIRFDLVIIEYEFADHSGPLLLAAARKASPAAHRVITSAAHVAAARSLVANHLADSYLSLDELDLQADPLSAPVTR